MRTPHVGRLLAIVLTSLAPSVASAQWTLPQGQLVVGTGFDFQYADSEFFGQSGEPRAERSFPLQGRYYGAQMSLDARLGLTDELELEVFVPLRVVAYVSDPVVLLEQPMGSMLSSLDYYQQNLIDLSQAQAGLADFQFVGRYRFTGPPFLITSELRLKVPAGYQGPQGTFGAEPRDASSFTDNVTTLVTPGNVSDDVVLGDGQVDLIGRVLFGLAFDTGTFVAGDIGYNARFDDAGHQLLASLRAGQLIENIVLLFAGASFGISVTEGRVIGVSVAADDPNVPAEQYGGLDNLLLREVRLQRDFLDVYGGVIFRLTPAVELKLAYSRTVWGRNTAAVSTFTIGVGARTALFEPDAPRVEEAYEEEEYEEDYDDEYEEEPYEAERTEEGPTETPQPETDGTLDAPASAPPSTPTEAPAEG